MAYILLIRHGEDLDNVSGILNGHRDQPLSPKGEEQALVAAQKVRSRLAELDLPTVAIYSSPLRRAQQTAQAIAEKIGLPVQTEPDLIERDFGVMTGLPVADILKLPPEDVLPTDRANYFLRADGSEDFPMLYKRARRLLTTVEQRHPDQNQVVILVAHGDIGKMIRAAFEGWSWHDGLTTPYFANTEIIELPAAPAPDQLK